MGQPSPQQRAAVALRAAVLSLAVGALILGVKLGAWLATGSSALLADALESIVNVVAAGMVAFTVVVAARPADRDHPYGHGKAEFLSAATEGALILLAATAIVAEAVRKLIVGVELERPGAGMLLATLGAVGNLALGLYLVRAGRLAGSDAIEADGRHVLTDVRTTLGAIGALVGVKLTGWLWLDPVVALAVGANIVLTGWQVVRRALAGLLDEADFELIAEVANVLERERRPDWIDIHELRTRRSGRFRHIDLHLVVPRYYTIDQAHAAAEGVESALQPLVGEEGGVVVHVDPCREWQCAGCEVDPCPVRSKPYAAHRPFDLPSLTRRGRL
jgi:cation diffusion facilitator family transporter